VLTVLCVHIVQEKIKSAFETSELRLYKAMVLIDGQQYERALQHLESVKKDIRDVIAWHEIKGMCVCVCGWS